MHQDELNERPSRQQWGELLQIVRRLRIVDPSCGEGHVLLGMLNVLDAVTHTIERHLDIHTSGPERRAAIVRHNLYGIEVQPDRAEHCRLALARTVAGSAPTLVYTSLCANIVTADALVERDSFLWETRFAPVFREGGFSLAVGNPPFVRHERIADPLERDDAATYKRRVFRDVRARLLNRPQGESQADGFKVDSRADLSLLFALSSMVLLRDSGALAFVLPTALFDARYGETLKCAVQLLGRTAWKIEDLERRAFPSAVVNTAIFVVGPRESSKHKGDEVQSSLLRKAQNIDRMLSTLPGERAAHSIARRTTLLGRIQEKCVALGTLGRVRYPIKTGLNSFFYPDAETIARFSIEQSFLIPVLRSPRDVKTIDIVVDDVRSYLFHCTLSLEQLKATGAHGALAYITWGSRQTKWIRGGQVAISWPYLPSLAARNVWYSVPLPAPADILCPRFIDRRYFFADNCDGFAEDQTFYGLQLAETLHAPRRILAAMVNSSLTHFMLEMHGRTGLGDGVRQYALKDMAALPVPDPGLLAQADTAPILAAFKEVAGRTILPVGDEYACPDRMQLDALVCEALHLREIDGREVRTAVLELNMRRLRRARQN